MISETMETTPAPARKEHAVFFRQSGWMMTAAIVGGFMSLGIHFLSKRVDQEQYGIFGILLMVTVCLPTTPLQMLLTQQTASALATNRVRQLSSMIRLTWLWTTGFWLIAALLVFVFRNQIALRWEMPTLTPLWITLATVLVALWLPIFGGALVGRQDFFWSGWSAILMGAFRLGVAAVLVLGFASGATGMMIGALAGAVAAVSVPIWRTRDFWRMPAEKFDTRAVTRKAVPLILGFWAFQFMFTSDTLFAGAFFPDQMGTYFAAGTLSRAMLWLVLPLATVMFPKLVHSNAKAEKNNLLAVVLLGTAVLAILGGVGLYVVGPLVVKMVFPPDYATAIMRLLPWYVGAMIPLTLTNVLVNDLMARDKFKVVPLIVLLAIVYGFTLPYVLNHVSKTPETILQALGGFNLLLLVVCAVAAFRKPKPILAR